MSKLIFIDLLIWLKFKKKIFFSRMTAQKDLKNVMSSVCEAVKVS
jgi:hypothetical protein